MMKIRNIIFALVAALLVSKVFSITTTDVVITNPTGGQLNLVKPSNTVYTYSVVFKNNNKSLNYTCSLYSIDKSISSVVYIQDTYKKFTINKGSITSIPITIMFPSVNEEKTYYGKITFYCQATHNNTTYVSIPVLMLNIRDNPWVYINRTTIHYPVVFYLNNYKFDVEPSSSGILINGKTVSYNLPVYFYNDTFKIIEVYLDKDSRTVSLVIYSKIPNPYFRIVKKSENTNLINKSENQVTNSGYPGEVDLYPTNLNIKLQQGVKSYSTVLYLYNGLDKPITIQRVIPIGDEYEFSDGTSEPVTNVKVPYNTLQPGDQIPIVVQMSSTKLQPGRYTITVNVFYMYNNRLHIKSSVLNIYVFQSQYINKKKLAIKLPESITLNKKFIVKVTGLGFDNRVNFSIIPKTCVEGTSNRTEDTFTYIGTVKCTKPISITVSVYKGKQLIQSISRQYLISKPKSEHKSMPSNRTRLRIMHIKLIPPNPKPGDTVTIEVLGVNNTPITNAVITVNGKKETTFVAQPMTTYVISVTAKGYEPATKTVHIPGKQMVVKIVPHKEKYTIGDTISIIAYDKETNMSLPITITVNGKPIQGNTFTIKHEGTYRIVINSRGYQPVTKTIVVHVPLQVYYPSKVKSGKTITISANKNVTWQVIYINPKTNKTVTILTVATPKKSIEFTPKNPGKYIIKAGNKQFVMAVSPNAIQVAGEVVGKLILIVLAIGIIWFLLKKLRRRGGGRFSSIEEGGRKVEVKPPSTIKESNVVRGLEAEPAEQFKEK